MLYGRRLRGLRATCIAAIVAMGIAGCGGGGGGGGGGMAGFVAPPATTPSPGPVASPTDQLAIVVQGTAVEAGSTIRVEGGETPSAAVAGADRRFQVPVSLRANAVNHLFLYEDFTNPNGGTSAPTPLTVVHDTTPPEVFIDFPADGASVIADETTITGRIGDLLSGFMGLAVDVDGIAGVVNIGLGTNGTFEVPGVPLTLGDNILTARAVDSLGNERSTSISVRRVPPGDTVLHKASGDMQQGTIRTQVAAPLVVRLSDADGTPRAGQLVSFRVEKSDGVLSADGVAPGSRLLQVHSDSQGLARAHWTLGADAGCGNQRVRVSATGSIADVHFTASAQAAAATQLSLGTGDGQIGVAGAPLAELLRVRVTDGCNGVAGVPVDFRVVAGDGYLSASGEADLLLTVVSDATGHAAVQLVQGSEGDQRVEIDFAGNLHGPVTFQADALEQEAGGTTAVLGLVLDNAQRPIGGVSCELELGAATLRTVSALDGAFRLEGLPGSGRGALRVDGASATHLDGTPIGPGSGFRFPSLAFAVDVIEGRSITTEPTLLPPLFDASAVSFDNSVDVELSCLGIEGLKLKVLAGSVSVPDPQNPGQFLVPDAANPVDLSLSQVHLDDLPMALPDGIASPFAWTLQPSGAHFAPPAQVTMPNFDGLAPGTRVNFLSFDHDTERFEVVAAGQTTEDGAYLVSDDGDGIGSAGWGGVCPPYPPAGDVERDSLADAKVIFNALYQQKLANGAASVAYFHQVLCIAEKACGVGSPSGGKPPWAQGVVTALLNDIARRAQRKLNPNGVLPLYPSPEQAFDDLDQKTTGFWASLWAGLGGVYTDLASTLEGVNHFQFELLPGFVRYWESLEPGDPDWHRHNQFLVNAVGPCFQEVDEFGVLGNTVASPLIQAGAVLTRDVSVAVMQVIDLFSDLVNFGPVPGGTADPFGYPVLPPPPTLKELYSDDIASQGALAVTAAGGSFFLQIGDTIQLNVARTLPDGTTADVTAASTGTQYLSLGYVDDVTITPDGLLTVNDAISALPSIPTRVFVVAGNGSDFGIGQFAILGRDTDGDLIADFFELKTGLDPNVPNPLDGDLDGDGLLDHHECLIGTYPNLVDTDGDGLSDSLEWVLGSDPTDFESTEPVADDRYTASIAGQSVPVQPDGSFLLQNVPAAPNLVRVKLEGSTAFGTRYGRSDPIEVLDDNVVVVPGMPLSDTPPPTVAMVSIPGPFAALDVTGQTLALRVDAVLSDGALLDVTLRSEGTTYTTSNPTIASVDEDGLVTAGSTNGIALITARNDGVVAVAQVTVALGDPFTTVEGRVLDAFGQAVGGADIQLFGGTLGATASDGRFSFPGQPTVLGDLLVSALVGSTSGSAPPLPPVPGGFTDVGDITVLPGSTGTDFRLSFGENLGFPNVQPSLVISSEQATAGTVDVPGLAFSTAFQVIPGVATTVSLPLSVITMGSDVVEDLGVRVSSQAAVSVYGINRSTFTTDAFAALPVDALGLRYRVASYTPLVNAVDSAPSQFSVVAAHDGTTITIVPSVAVGGHAAGVPYAIQLDDSQVYTLQSDDQDTAGDLTGTLVTADRPVGVLSGHACAFVPVGVFACDVLVEQLPSVDYWGTQYFSVNLATRQGGDTFRVLGDQDATLVTIDGPNPQSFTLNAGEFVELLLDGFNEIRSDRPVLVMQYANGQAFDNITGDPFMMTLTPAERFRTDSVFATPASGFNGHFVNLVVPQGAPRSVLVNGTVVPAASFAPIGTSGFLGAQVSIPPGSNRVSAPVPIGVYVYGFGSFDSYGYPAGL